MKQTRTLFLLAALALFAGACVVNVEEGEPAPVTDGGERLVTLALSVPGPPASRGLTTDQESEVHTIDVLLFTANSNEYFRYRAIGDVDPVTGKKFSVKLPGGTWNVVVLANAGQAFDKLVDPLKSLLAPAKLAPDASIVARREVLEHLVLQLNDKTKKWPEGAFAGIPMWGYHDGLAINASTPATAATIDLTRAVARVNVSVVDDDASDAYDVTTVFSLESVRLYNYNRAGSIAPAAVNGAGYDAAQWSGSEATLQNLPGLALLVDGVTPLKVTGPLEYNVPTAQKHDYSREIYTFEAAAGAGTSLSTNTCLVIGARYNGELSYYRVDFAKNDGTYLSLLRNHSYNVKIKEVFAAGYASVAEAFDNKPSNIRVEIDEDDGTIGHVVFNEQNYLGTSTGEITVPANARDGYRFTANTDVFDGWEITGTSATDEPHAGFDVSWITGLTPASGPAGGTTNVTFNAGENATGARRVGYIHLQAGLLHLAVKVTQLATGIWITEAGSTNEMQELFFNSAGVVQPPGEDFVVHWLPAGAQVNAMMIPVSQRPAFDYDLAHDTPGEGAMTDLSDPSGQAPLTVQPAALTVGEIGTFVEKASTVRFVAFHDGDFASADIKLRHADYHTLVDVEAYYMIGNVHSFTVRSNSSWVISNVSDPDKILDLSYTPALLNRSGGHSSTGEKVYFKLVNDVSKDAKTAVLTLVDPTGPVGNVTVTIKGMACGMDGIAVTKRIGDNDYETHLYADKCWMVQNSREGSYFEQYYNGNIATALVGYYYTWTQATTIDNVCPSGWHLPTVAEATDLVNEINADLSNSKARWWGGPGMLAIVKTGHYWLTNSAHWHYGSIYGEWWCDAATALCYGGANSGMWAPSNGADNCFCVRCVQD